MYHNSKMIILYVKKDHGDAICGRGVGKGGVGGSDNPPPLCFGANFIHFIYKGKRSMQK